MKKNLVVTITIVTAISLSILTGCGNTQTTSSDPLTTPSTTIEQVVETATDTEATTTTTEQTELENQDKDPTEATTQTPSTTGTTQQTTQGTTQETTTAPTTQTPTTEATNPGHVHTWVTETYYTTETQVVHHDAVTHTVHHDAVTHQEQVTTYTTETQTVHHDGCYTCNSCGATFSSESDAIAHCTNSMSCYTAGYSGSPEWDEQVTVQVPHTTTQTVVDQEAWDETVVDTPAWDETVEVQVPHTRTVCSECGAVK